MNSTAQSAGINLLSSPESVRGNSQKGSLLNPGSSDNSFNYKDFSGVLREQQAVQAVAEGSPVSDAAADAWRSETAPIQVMLVDSEGNTASVIGKVLPQAMEQLPLPVGEIAAVEDASVTVNTWQDTLKLPSELVERAEPTTEWSDNPVAVHTETGLTVPVHTQAQPAAGAVHTPGAERLNGVVSSVLATDAQAVDQAAIASKTAVVQTPTGSESAVELAAYSPATTASKAGSQADTPFAAALLASESPLQGRRSAERPVANAPAIDTAEALVKPNLSPAASPAEVNQAYKTASQSLASVDVAKPGFSEAVMQRVMWMSSQQINRADIALDPPELGSLQVRVSTQADQTSVVFSSPHSAVRDALDSGLSRLREMLEQQGLNLVDVDVSEQGAEQQHADRSAQALSKESSGEDFLDGSAESEAISANPPRQHSLQLVDHYV